MSSVFSFKSVAADVTTPKPSPEVLYPLKIVVISSIWVLCDLESCVLSSYPLCGGSVTAFLELNTPAPKPVHNSTMRTINSIIATIAATPTAFCPKRDVIVFVFTIPYRPLRIKNTRFCRINCYIFTGYTLLNEETVPDIPLCFSFTAVLWAKTRYITFICNERSHIQPFMPFLSELRTIN